jgi:mRNA-degrading endonuclease YafQ of YafQ-DinJ toxin-antitoxin module
VTVKVNLWPQVTEDFRSLPTNGLRLMAMKHLLRLEDEPYFGLHLTDHPVWGDLSDCRKIYLDESHEVDPRWRIIYKLLPDEQNPDVADVMIIGPRDDDLVYRQVMVRLGRPLGGRLRTTPS